MKSSSKTKPDAVKEISAAAVQAVFDQLHSLTSQEIALILHVSRATVYNWYNSGVPATNRSGIRNFDLLTQHIAKHGVRSLLEGKALAVETTPSTRIGRRCLVLTPRNVRLERCKERRLPRQEVCVQHEKDLQAGRALMLINGKIVGRSIGYEAALLAQQCVAIALGGRRCQYVGYYPESLCHHHEVMLKYDGHLTVIRDGLTEKYYAVADDN